MIADELVAAVQDGDRAAMERIYHPELEFVIHIDGAVRSRQEAIDSFWALRRDLCEVWLEITDRQPTPDGYVSQQVLHALAPDGSRHAVPHCLVVRLRDGRIGRIDEYLDSAQLSALVAALAT